MIKANRGVNAFNMPESALERCWPASEKSSAGSIFPVKPAHNKGFHCSGAMSFLRCQKKGIKNIVAEKIRKAPTCIAE